MIPLLSVNDLTVEFGGVRALDNVSITVAANSVHGLVGPNGSGKTTLINAVSGFVRPTAGSIRLGDSEITGIAPYRRARMGIARSFQQPLMFKGLTVSDTLGVGAHLRNPYTWLKSLVPVVSDRAQGIRDGLIRESAGALGVEVEQSRMAEVSFGRQRLVDLARASAGTPRLLLLDEPASGLSEKEIDDLVEVVGDLRDRGVTILVTDHNMNFMARVCDHLTVINVGKNLADGTPAEMRADSKVVDAYLGRVASGSNAPSSSEASPRGGTSEDAGSLSVTDVTAAYDGAPVLQSVSLRIPVGRITALVGPNGAGKTSLLNVISGTLRVSSGHVEFDSSSFDGLTTEKRLVEGVAHVPQGRGMIDGLTVRENLEMGGYSSRDRAGQKRSLEAVLEIWPFLAKRMGQKAGSLSGGEQQMLSIARALMSSPRIILLDEPTLGLAPVMVDRLLDHIERLRERGVGILIVEQNTSAAFSVSEHGYVLSGGRVVLEGPPEKLAGSEELEHAFMGVEVD